MYTFYNENQTGKDINIFISHSILDKNIAVAVETYLCEGLKIDLQNIFRCTRKNNIPKGEPSHDVILEAMRESNIAIFLITPNSVSSRYCYYEMGACWALGIKPFIVYFEPLSVSDNIFKNLPFTQIQSSNIVLSNEDSIYDMLEGLKNIIHGIMNEPDDLSWHKNKFMNRVSNEISNNFKLNLQDGRVFVHDSYSDDILKVKKVSKDEIAFCIDYTKSKPKYTGYAVRLHDISWISFFEKDYAFSFNYTPKEELKCFYIEFKGKDKKMIGRKKITISENDYNKNIHYQFLLRDINVNSIYWKQMSEIVILFISESVEESSELYLDDICFKKCQAI